MNLHALRSALRYAWRAETIYDVHAPLAFGFVGEVVEDRRHFYLHDEVESLRARYAASDETVGSGEDGTGTGPRRRVRTLARGEVSARTGRYLTSLVDWRGARRIVHVGCGLGVGSCCLAGGMPAGGRLVALETDGELGAFAKTALARTVPYAEAEVLAGGVSAELEGVLERMGGIDVAVLEGRLGERETRAVCEQLVGACHKGSAMVLSGIHGDEERAAAWAWLKARPGVRASFDVYALGVVLFAPSSGEAKHYEIMPWRWKPWHMGFFGVRG